MRKLILISAFVLASVSAQAGDNRSLILAANDNSAAATTPAAPEAVKTEATKTEAIKTEEAKPEAAKVDVKADVKADAATPEAKKQASSSKKTHARHYEGDEATAHLISSL